MSESSEVQGKPSPATTRQTAGPGFTFEDFTAAWLMIRLLIAEALPGVGTAGHTIQSQTGASRWQIDDLLVTAGYDADTYHLALSCKSNMQVSRNGLPADFVERAWKQWREPGSPMRRETDVLALVNRGQPATFTPQWSNIVNWCAGADPKLAIARIRATKNHTRIFESIKSPGGTCVATDEETVELIRHLEVISLDFQLEPPSCREGAISKCRGLLQSGDRKEAEAVWINLVQMATDTRVGSGTLTVGEVWEKLRKSYDLRDQPNFESSWDALKALTQDYKAKIETALPSSFIIERREDKIRLSDSIRNQLITVVFGESGSGKSALVKTTLDEEFSAYNQVWLGPEQVEVATTALDRRQIQLMHPLYDVLQASANPHNVLVIDAAEKLSDDALTRIKQLFARLVSASFSTGELPWHVVLVSQTDGWRDRIQMNIGQPVELPLGVENTPIDGVKAALWVSYLGWLTFRDDTVAALRNLRTLAWVIQASTAFQAGSARPSSPAEIADRIWQFWTAGKVAYHSLLIRLAERDAEFERSFALSELDAADVAIYESKPAHLPLRKNTRNRIEFQHDLAADWARYQRLKELSADVGQWVRFATNPLWSGALHLLGQFLLREPAETASGWDHAFSALEEKGENFAADVLLDALCLDPQARQFLEGRAELLFTNHGKLLNRLLRRFLHLATVPSAPQELRGFDHALALYFEAKFRTPIVGLRPSMAGFLHEHLQRVAELVSPTVAEVCEVWLTKIPPQLGEGIPTPWRKEFAEIALATARALQVEQGKRTIYFGYGERPIYSAALAGGWDLPDEVAIWALEMMQRRPQSEEVASRIAAAKAKAAAEHQERLRTDPEFRANQQKAAKRRSSFPTSISRSRKKLPPWPMGPKNSVERDFRQVVLHTPALAPLMHQRPDLAAEVMLATLIEGNPTEEYSETMRFEEEVGLEYDGGDSYPTAFWKSRFFSFLQIAPDVALTTLIRLVNFATKRWAYRWDRGSSGKSPQTTLTMRDGSRKSYVGNWRVFDWTQANSNSIGQLHCALNALERWLTLQIEQGVDVQPDLERLLKEGSSLAFVGLLVNVAKYRPALFSGALLPVLSSEDLYRLDGGRVTNARFNFVAFEWSRQHDAIFNLARDWTNAPYRQQNLVQGVGELIPRNKTIASFLKTAIATWEKPNEPKRAIEFAILCAQLDEANYRLQRDSKTGEEKVEFGWPEAVKREVAAYQNATAPKLQNIVLAHQCEQMLQRCTELTEAGAQALAEFVSAAPSEDDPDDKGLHQRNKLAAAATLVACTKEWHKAHPEVDEAAKSELRAAVDRISDSSEELRRSRYLSSDEGLKFAAYGVFHLWLRGGEDEFEWERALLRVLTSGDDRAAGVLGSLAYRRPMELGDRWWRLLELAVLWSALSTFRPGFDDPPDVGLRWIRWLRSRRISGVPGDISSVDLLSAWQRLKRLERGRWRRALAQDRSRFTRSPDEPPSHGLDTGFLDSFFGWLLADSSRPNGQDLEIGRQVLLALWSYEAAYCSEDRDEHGEYRLPSQFGFNILAKLAFYAAHVPAHRASEIWRGVLQLGPAARGLIEHFVSAWFIQLRRSSSRWTPNGMKAAIGSMGNGFCRNCSGLVRKPP